MCGCDEDTFLLRDSSSQVQNWLSTEAALWYRCSSETQWNMCEHWLITTLKPPHCRVLQTEVHCQRHDSIINVKSLVGGPVPTSLPTYRLSCLVLTLNHHSFSSHLCQYLKVSASDPGQMQQWSLTPQHSRTRPRSPACLY